MKKIVLVFLVYSGILFATQTRDVNKGKIQTVISVEEITQLKSENEELKSKVLELEKVVNNVKDVKEASNIYYNVDQFYKSSWEKLLWTLGAIGGIGALLFNKYTNTVKIEIEKSKKEIKEYTIERIRNYEDLIANYKKNTIDSVEEKVKNMIESELKVLNDKIQEEDGKLEEIEFKMENTQSNLEEMSDKIEEIKKIAWMNL